MTEAATQETFDQAVTRLLDGRPLTWLADQSGVPYWRLHRLMNPGGRRPHTPRSVTLEEAAAIATALKVAVTEFLPGGAE